MSFRKHEFWAVLLKPMVLPFFLVALVDCGMTTYGTATLLGRPRVPGELKAFFGPIALPIGHGWSWIVGLIVGVGVLITLLSTCDIWSRQALDDLPILRKLLRVFWWVVFLYDYLTTFLGIVALLEVNIVIWSASTFDFLDLMRTAAVGVASFIVSASTIVASFMAYREM